MIYDSGYVTPRHHLFLCDLLRAFSANQALVFHPNAGAGVVRRLAADNSALRGRVWQRLDKLAFNLTHCLCYIQGKIRYVSLDIVGFDHSAKLAPYGKKVVQSR